MMDVLEFALDNAFIKMPDGRILWQKEGIPMGRSTVASYDYRYVCVDGTPLA